MPLADEMTFQRIETLLDMRFKKLHEEIRGLKDELGALQEEFGKHAKQAAAAPQVAYPPQQWQQAPPQAYPQQPQEWAQAPPQAAAPATNRYANQFAAASAPAPEPVQNKWAPPAEKAPSTQPIDRNGVAPADVSIEKFFYMGNKR